MLGQSELETSEPSSLVAELSALGDLLGTRCVDARQLENSVIDKCDATVELQQQRLQLTRAQRELSKLEDRQRLLLAKTPSPGNCPADSQETDNVQQTLASEIEEAKLRVDGIRGDIQQLEVRANAPSNFRSQVSAARSVPPQAISSALLPTSSSSSSSSSLPTQSSSRWGRLKGSNTLTGPVLLDEDLDDDDDDDSAGALFANPNMERQQTQQQPQRQLQQLQQQQQQQQPRAEEVRKKSASSADEPAVTMTAKEYLSRIRVRQPTTSPSTNLCLDSQNTSQRASGSSSIPASTATEMPSENKELPTSTSSKKQKICRSQMQADSVLSEQVDTADSDTTSTGQHYSIDMQHIVPKAAMAKNVWKDANPAEWRATQTQGETVSPHQNVLKLKPGEKRNRPTNSAAQTPNRARRDDDSDDRAFKRRQIIWNRTSQGTSTALNPKQSVDASGAPVKTVKTVKMEPGVEHACKAEVAGEGKLQDDVTIAEGLRCPRWLWEALYPYQHTCVKWLWGLHCDKIGGILADEMGLGKTIQIAAFLAVLHHSGILQTMTVQNTSLGTACAVSTGGVLIVCPATLISQWRNELHLWYPPLRVCIMHQVSEQERREAIHISSSQQGVLITSYETMRIALDDLLQATWVMVILDEGQKIRNPHANITIAAKRFSTPHRVILSGSPIQNNLRELWSLFDFICPGRLGTLPVFSEEFAQPIELGNLVGANQARVAAAYECALALRELTMPCILRRTKAEVMDVLKLPAKQEQVLFCNLTPEQYQVYIDVLQTDQVRRAMNSSQDKKNLGLTFFAISVLRKLCNHPDLLLMHADPELHPPDMWTFERSGKMKVLSEIMKLWKSERHRALIFVQTIQMLEVIQRWLNQEGYTHLHIDGRTPVKRRLKMIEEFNGNADLFAMLLTTRVGGVGLNIIGADRVVIFDPDWNPMTDVQARERTWRIGQRKDVAVYRLVLTGTLEEKIYQRQVYKHFLSQKVLNDPRQRQFFKWNDLADLFELPPPPPSFNSKEMAKLKEKYKPLFAKLDRKMMEQDEEYENETTEVMKSITELPQESHHVPSKDATEEHNAILQTLYDSQGIKATFNHDKVEQPLLDRKIVKDGAHMIAQRALSALKKSGRERASHHISEPTWTGQRGSAGATNVKKEIKREHATFGETGPSFTRRVAAKSGVSSADILEGLKQLAAIRALAKQRGSGDSGTSNLAAPAPGTPPVAAERRSVGLPTELLQSDRKIGEMILEAFLDPKLAGQGHSLTTGQVVQHLAQGVAAHHSDLFKELLKQMCELSKASHPSQPGVWTLRTEFWPKSQR